MSSSSSSSSRCCCCCCCCCSCSRFEIGRDRTRALERVARCVGREGGERADARARAFLSLSLPLSLFFSRARDMSFLRALRARGSSFPSLSLSPSPSGNWRGWRYDECFRRARWWYTRHESASIQTERERERGGGEIQKIVASVPFFSSSSSSSSSRYFDDDENSKMRSTVITNKHSTYFNWLERLRFYESFEGEWSWRRFRSMRAFLLSFRARVFLALNGFLPRASPLLSICALLLLL